MISIIVPVYNAEKYLKATIESLLRQTYRDFELIAIDDGSTDNSWAILQSFTDPRLRILRNNANRGIVCTRNRGLSEMKGKYYAPFDADDIAHPTKLEKQIHFLESNPDFGMVGSWVRIIDGNGRPTGKIWRLNAPAELIPSILLFRNYFAQSALLIRKEAIPKEGYPDYSICQDYGMWIEIAKNWKTKNLEEYLIQYRIHTEGITRNEETLKKEQLALTRENFHSNGFSLSIEEIKSVLPDLIDNSNACAVSQSCYAFQKILKQNYKLNAHPHHLLWKATWMQWLRICYRQFKASSLLRFPWLTVLEGSIRLVGLRKSI